MAGVGVEFQVILQQLVDSVLESVQVELTVFLSLVQETIPRIVEAAIEIVFVGSRNHQYSIVILLQSLGNEYRCRIVHVEIVFCLGNDYRSRIVQVEIVFLIILNS